ncbi:GNAT family N-acetyltransferase [Aquabacterium sp.]|uniref:GNAT family N-acetyltransferase n=1 Tax=Aquabacterium sp. TaxID=1872578 RepID=UPI002C718022|nr:GNAT family N-acetyltransferase [Aquabacterium sp.]HSW09027.1 GNAT family N-acetyltransferase [Aquabacterium sp.]
MRLALESPDQPDVIALIDALDAYQKPLYPPESHHGIDIAALSRPGVLFAVARSDAGQALGCGAIVIGPDFGEIKRMFVQPAERGQGLSKALMSFLEVQALERGCRLFMLETGPLQAEALGLYERMGYRRCGPFGSYGEDPHSVFMVKPVDTPSEITCTVHDELPPDDARLVDDGLVEANDRAAPLHEVRPLACFARLPSGQPIGGAVGRTWGRCCELQQLWVDPALRRQGLATRLVQAFEARATERGCHLFYLETFNFQAPALYRSLGYRVVHEHAVYPHGIVKVLMVRDGAAPAATS